MQEILGGAGIVAQVGAPKHEAGGGGPGAPGKVTFQFEPVSPGRTQLQFIYHRTFEPNVPPARTVDLTVMVK